MVNNTTVTLSSTVLSKVVFLTPGSTSFPGAQNHYIITLMQWQFWWWFWFTGMLAIYDVFYSRFFYNRLPHLAPKIVTSYRSHGRWGDLIICLIPVGWCMNILSNSHFLLRALEWQTETAPFFLRVRGKQWYWVYKIDLNNFASIEDIPKIIGRGKKVQFSRGTDSSDRVQDRFVELKYTNSSRQDQIFVKINQNTNSSRFSTTPSILKGNTNTVVRYKNPFGLIINPVVDQNTLGSKKHVLWDISWDKTEIEVDYPERLGPPWPLIRGGRMGGCARFWMKSIVLPDSFSITIESVFSYCIGSSTKLLRPIAQGIIIKDLSRRCRADQIAMVRAWLTPTLWPVLSRVLDGSHLSRTGGKKYTIHIYDIPVLQARVSGLSLFSELHRGTFPVNRRSSIYSLMSSYVDFSKEFPKIVKVALGYKSNYIKKVYLLNRCRVKKLWSNRVGYIKKSLLFNKLYLGMFMRQKVLTTMHWSRWLEVSNFIKTHNSNVITKSAAASIFKLFTIYVGRSVWKRIVLRLSWGKFFGELVDRKLILNSLYPLKTNPYLTIAMDILRFGRRHHTFPLDPCARIIKNAFWKPQISAFGYGNTLAKILHNTFYNWCTYKLHYSYWNLVVETVCRILDADMWSGTKDKYIKLISPQSTDTKYLYFLKRRFSSNRWSRSLSLVDRSILLVKTPTSSDKPLELMYYCPNESPVKHTNTNVSITIKQKKVEKTIFDSKLNTRQYSQDNSKASLVYTKAGGVLKLVPNYNHIDQKVFRDGYGSRTTKSNGPVFDKSYLHNKRLLWVNKILLLPTHVAITIVTNSYDVIHSWFIPGLGLKLDCVPGRSTHHTIYIEYGGYYYGQCAEVCGRRHHHMPIKIRAIPFMIFAYWWREQLRSDFVHQIN